ncbi:hypothetical protein [Acidithiobacillus sp. IBUN Pt1247-S3]|uniref:hypothetical protein n=1 Tax=Acidithiobacillus sp. IBUN Pt1247-S3 TaxID=3166642 RepID=UPI0034E429B2
MAWRTSASRAYYGAFHAAREVAPENIRNTKKDAHEKLISWLAGHGKNDWRTVIGVILQQIRDHRRKADYERCEPGERSGGE